MAPLRSTSRSDLFWIKENNPGGDGTQTRTAGGEMIAVRQLSA